MVAAFESGDGDDAVVEHLVGERRAKFHLEFFRLRGHHRAAFFDVGGDDIAAERNDGGVPDDAFMEHRDVCGTATDVHQCHACLFFLIAEGGIGAGNGFEGQVGDFETGLFDAAVDVVDGSDLPRDDVKVCF